MSDKYTVFGNPIAHSKSPQIHEEFAKQTEQSLGYSKTLASEQSFAEDLSEFFARGGKGCNITVPFKTQAFGLADELDESARTAEAVNTIAPIPGTNSDGKSIRIKGYNTDGVGLMLDITQNLGWPIKDNKVLVLGAGGAVMGILLPLIKQRPQEVLIANRTAKKAIDLANKFSSYASDYGVKISAGGFEAITGQWDLIINGTAASLSGDMPALSQYVLHQKTYCYDLMYSEETTVFNLWCQQNGITEKQCADGLGMLVEQAASAFEIWHGTRPKTNSIIERLRNH